VLPLTITKPKMALAKLTKDSMASDSKPTESVIHQAKVLSAMVMMATTIEAHINVRGDQAGSFAIMALG
jgi:hypothetical protein